jgi:hypothetical protein
MLTEKPAVTSAAWPIDILHDYRSMSLRAVEPVRPAAWGSRLKR